MLLQEKMKAGDFSPSERAVVNFLLEKQELIEDYTTTRIAGETYTSPSVLVRISKKLGFSGYSQLKKAFLEEVRYLKRDFGSLDANQPFLAGDSPMTIAAAVTKLKEESLQDTLSLLRRDRLQKAVRLLENGETIRVFAVSNLTFLAEEFVHKLRHTGIRAETYSTSNTMYQEAKMATCRDCALCLSYSGETPELLRAASLLRQNRVPLVVLSSVGENSLTRMAAVVLQVATREKSYSKIGAFSSLESMALLLDILYSCLFAADYDRRYSYKINLSKATEFRSIDNGVIREE